MEVWSQPTIISARHRAPSCELYSRYGPPALRDRAHESGAVLLRGTFATSSAKAGGVARKAELKSPEGSAARGKAEIEIERKKGVVTEDEIEVTAERLSPSANCKLMVDGQEAMSFTTTSKGKST